MPIYAFDCGECGPFDVVRPVAEVALPAACPTCARAARRTYTPPALAHMPPPLRRAREREEKSAHEPDVVTRKEGRPLPHQHGRGAAHPMPWVLSH
jgi:putative FmdB family regulatory protein